MFASEQPTLCGAIGSHHIDEAVRNLIPTSVERDLPAVGQPTSGAAVLEYELVPVCRAEVAGSILVAPVNVPASRHLLLSILAQTTAGHSCIPRISRTRLPLQSPQRAARRR